MLHHATQARRELAVFTPLGDDVLLLRRLEGHEEISRLFQYDLEMLSAQRAIDPRAIVGRNVTVLLARRGQRARHFNGFVSRFGAMAHSVHGTTYRATVLPWLWFLTRTTDCRIFQNKTSPQIIEQIFHDQGFSDFELKLKGQYAPREYCVQYRETDFAFVSRLMEEEGIFYFFRHENGKHVLVLADHKVAYFELADSAVELRHGRQLERQLTAWEHRHEFRPGRWAQTDYDFKKPRLNLMSQEETVVRLPGNQNYEMYDYPGCFEDRGRGRSLTRVRMEEEETPQEMVLGAGSYRSCTPGGTFTVRRHADDRAEEGREYVVASVEHRASVDGDYISGSGTGETEYDNRFTCIPATTTFRPSRTTPRPTVGGPQTAVVVGPAGEQIYTDEFGRVKVQFHWDREGKRDENSSCWLRVSQVHAGKGWGEMDLPRVGEEVVVAFLEGDPDRPIIKGRVYNQGQMPPFGLPDAKARCSGKTQTYQGSGYNEMSMDDTAGKEQVRVNAQHNMDSNVNNCKTLAVGVDRSGDVGNNQDLSIAVDGTLEVGNDCEVTVGNDATYIVGNNIEITAGVAITLKCGASTIHMNCGGVITFSGQFITSAAAANQSITAPLTQVVGSSVLLQAGLVCMDLGGVVHVKGGETSVSAGTISIKGGETLLQGAPLKLGEVGAPVIKIPTSINGMPVSVNPDGSVSVGKSITIGGSWEYKDAVLKDLQTIASHPTGQQVLQGLENSGHAVNIVPIEPPPDPANAFSAPDGPGGFLAGKPLYDEDGNIVGYGTGTGADSTVGYNPDQWPSPDYRTRPPGDSILLHELEHSRHFANGQADPTPRPDGFHNNEEFNTINTDNNYRDEIHHPQRYDHTDL